MPTDKQKFTVIVDDELNKQIEDYFYNNRLRSKSAAAVELIKMGLQVVNEKSKSE